MNLFNAHFLFDSVFLVFFINILVYTVTLSLIFSLLSVTNTSNLNFVTGFNVLSSFPSFKFFFVFSILSLCGVPPLLGFFAKLYIFNTLFMKFAYFNVGIFFLFNMFAMYFYLQNTRYLIFSSYKKIFKTSFSRFRSFSFFYNTIVISFLFLGFFFFYLDYAIVLLSNIVI